MEGYDVVTIEDEKVGKVVDTHGDNLIVEQERSASRSTRCRTFAEVDDGEQMVRMTVTKDIFCDSPKIDGEVDETAIALHCGLAEDSAAPATEGHDETTPRSRSARRPASSWAARPIRACRKSRRRYSATGTSTRRTS